MFLNNLFRTYSVKNHSEYVSIDRDISYQSAINNLIKTLGIAILRWQDSGYDVFLSVASFFCERCVEVMPEGFEAIELLGSGAYSEVFKVKNLAEGSFVAIKKTDLLEAENLRHVLNEEKILKELKHPNIIEYLDGKRDDTRQVYYSYLSLGPRKTLLKKAGKLWQRELRKVARQLSSLILFLETKQVLHRDIKLENVLVDSNLNITLVDFAFAKYLNRGERAYTYCGSIHYMAPEILTGKGYGFESQWWAYGVVLSALAFKKYPFNSSPQDGLEQYSDTKFQILNHNPSYNSYNIGFDENLVDLLFKLLNKNQDSRYSFKDIECHPWF